MTENTEPEESYPWDEACDEACEAEPSDILVTGNDINWGGNVASAVVALPNQGITFSGGTVTATGNISANPDKSSEKETPTEVLQDHLDFLKGRKAGYEMNLHHLTTEYGAAEKGLNVVTGGIEETEKALKLLEENQIN